MVSSVESMTRVYSLHGSTGSPCPTYPFWLLTPILLFLLLSCSVASAQTPYSRTQILMGNVPVSITIRTKPSQEARANQAMEAAFEKAKTLESIFSEYQPQSAVSQFNQSPSGKWVSVPAELAQLLQDSKRISQITYGAFDVTFRSTNPTATYQDLDIDLTRNRVRANKPQMQIGVSSIAKGAIVDAMSRLLSRQGFGEHLVNAGGDIYAAGRWNVRVQDPRAKKRGDSQCQVSVENQGVSTSGTYERGLHLINPKTKEKVHGHLSTTVVAENTTLSSPLATGGYIMKNPFEMLDNKFEIGILVIDENGIKQRGIAKFKCK